MNYTIGRLLGVLTRPATLFLANNCFDPAVAQGLAIAFLSCSLGLVSTAADPHRRFYALHFATEGRTNGLLFHVYAMSTVLLALVGCVVVVAMGLHFSQSPTLTLTTCGYFLSEKLADEVLRYRMFERDLAGWGRLNAARSALQLVALGLLVWVYRSSGLTAALIVLIFTIANLAIIAPAMPRELARGIHSDRVGVLVRLGVRATQSLAQNGKLWVMALLTSGVGYLDRLVALVIDRPSLPLFMLVVMCFSVAQLSVDSYYVSRHRRDFLERRISAGAAVTSRELLGTLLAGLIVAAIACYLILRTSRDAGDFPHLYVLAIASLQITAALAGVFREILYWSEDLGSILRIETAFWLAFMCVALASGLGGIAPAGIFILVVVCALARLGLYFLSACRAGSAWQPAPRGFD